MRKQMAAGKCGFFMISTGDRPLASRFCIRNSKMPGRCLCTVADGMRIVFGNSLDAFRKTHTLVTTIP